MLGINCACLHFAESFNVGSFLEISCRKITSTNGLNSFTLVSVTLIEFHGHSGIGKIKLVRKDSMLYFLILTASLLSICFSFSSIFFLSFFFGLFLPFLSLSIQSHFFFS